MILAVVRTHFARLKRDRAALVLSSVRCAWSCQLPVMYAASVGRSTYFMSTGTGNCVVVLACLVARPALAQFPPITSRDYAIDLYDGVAIGNTAMVGMGGAGAADVLGTAGVLLNPSAALGVVERFTCRFDTVTAAPWGGMPGNTSARKATALTQPPSGIAEN